MEKRKGNNLSCLYAFSLNIFNLSILGISCLIKSAFVSSKLISTTNSSAEAKSLILGDFPLIPFSFLHCAAVLPNKDCYAQVVILILIKIMLLLQKKFWGGKEPEEKNLKKCLVKNMLLLKIQTFKTHLCSFKTIIIVIQLS